MSEAEAVAIVLLVGATFYAIFGGADFGAGAWQLFSFSAADPEAVRHRIERSVAPVWEANHVWLIFVLVYLWTGFPEAFSAVMTTLYIPLALAAVGIVLRGSGFAFAKAIPDPWRRRAISVFALSSIMTPFFMGTVVGAIASGQVPAEGNGDPTASWIGLAPFALGALFVASGAYLAAIFLVHDSVSTGEEDNARQFGRWALGTAVVSGALAVLGLFALSADAEFVWDRLTDEALPLVAASILCGAVVTASILRVALRGGVGLPGMRPFAIAAVVAVVWGGGVAFHPYLLPPADAAGSSSALTIEAAAAPDITLTMLLVVFAIALVIVVPALLFLYTLSQKRLLE